MKKVVKLISGLSALLLLTFVSCNNETEEVIPKAVAEKVSVASVEVPAEVIAAVASNEVTVVSEESKADVETELKESLSAEAFQEMLNSFATNKDEIVESARDVSVEDLSGILNEFSQKMEKFTEELQNNGNASMNFSKTPGTVTGLQEGVEMNIPVIFYNMGMSSSTTETKVVQAMSLIAAFGSSVGVDCSQIEGMEEFFFKNLKANIAWNTNSAIKMSVDMTNYNTDYSEVPTFDYSGKINTECNFSVGGVFVTKNNVAGKLLSTLDFKINTDDFSSFVEFIQNSATSETLDTEVLFEELSKILSVEFNISVYDFDGNEIFNLINAKDFDSVSEYIDLQTLIEEVMVQNEIQ